MGEEGEGEAEDGVLVESCKWFNLITAFLFQELRDTPMVKRSVRSGIHMSHVTVRWLYTWVR